MENGAVRKTGKQEKEGIMPDHEDRKGPEDRGHLPEMEEMEGKYLTFVLENEEYGISITHVREIIGMMPVTTVPRTPEFVRGVINLRGKVIPVVDLRIRFGMERIETTDRTCIIIVEVIKGNDTVILGIVVDSVSEVLAVKAQDIEPPPSFGAQLDTRYIRGMAKLEGGVKILLDIDRVFDTGEIAAIEQTT